ncbi:MAG: class I SAM-dependent methyltransferase [Trichloromonas sp.]|jgi:16S rRNA C1402 N4-methylase RsmH|nr:class I SAM-dependent methyltransferase [Trichloromonas sp.]
MKPIHRSPGRPGGESNDSRKKPIRKTLQEPSLIRMVRWAQRLLAEVLEPGGLAIDLTAGNGADALFLARQVGPEGRVLAFDVQMEALRHTGARLTEAGISWTLDDQDDAGTVRLVHDSHARLAQYTQGPARGIMANLGYRPGGDRGLTTQAEATLEALQQALDILAIGGRMALVIYIGHPQGEEECRAVEEWLRGLSSRHWHILRVQVVNRLQAPYLLVVERRG